MCAIWAAHYRQDCRYISESRGSTAHPISGAGFELVMGPAVVRLHWQWLSFSAGLLYTGHSKLYLGAC